MRIPSPRLAEYNTTIQLQKNRRKRVWKFDRVSNNMNSKEHNAHFTMKKFGNIKAQRLSSSA